MNIAFSIFGLIPVYTFPLILGLGSALGFLWASYESDTRLWFDVGGYVFLGAVIVGRIGYVLLNWPYFQANLFEMPQIWLGGLTWWGALGGAVLAILISAQRVAFSMGEIADHLLPVFTSIVISAWLACWLTGNAYGVSVDAWWGIPAKDEWGIISTRWPTQFLGAASTLLLHWIVEERRNRGWLQISGMAATFQVVGVLLFSLMLIPFRADPAPIFRGLRLDFWITPGYIIFFILILLIAWTIHSKSTNHSLKHPTN